MERAAAVVINGGYVFDFFRDVQEEYCKLPNLLFVGKYYVVAVYGSDQLSYDLAGG